ncbi:MAG TPA: cell division protein FtsB [Burkholderiales bacterium]|nr:cell division protein FtsB [Burkholderiales bacterium]
MRLLAVALVVLIAALQWPLWMGKGGWLHVWELDQQVKSQRESNERLRARNAALDAEVRDLKTGYAAIEERARTDLGMVKRDEVFFEVIGRNGREAPPPAR